MDPQTHSRAGQWRDDESGFTLIELLVVVIIIGILAAIALPVFLSQQNKGQDASAISDVRNAVSQVESCFVNEQSYSSCDETATAMAQANLGATVDITAPSGADLYEIEATSKSGHVFTITKSSSGAYTRTCTGAGAGGCKSDSTW